MILQAEYDEETGTLVEKVDGAVREIYEVRNSLLDAEITTALIKELERKGYVVLGPYLSTAESS